MTSNSTTDCETERMYNDERKISTQKVRKGWKTSTIKSCQNENRKGFQRESSWYSHDRLARLGWNYATLSRWQLSASRARVTTHWVGNPYSTTKTEKKPLNRIGEWCNELWFWAFSSDDDDVRRWGPAKHQGYTNKYYVARGYHLSEDDAPRQPAAAHDRSRRRHGWEDTVTEYSGRLVLSINCFWEQNAEF